MHNNFFCSHIFPCCELFYIEFSNEGHEKYLTFGSKYNGHIERKQSHTYGKSKNLVTLVFWRVYIERNSNK